jgi:uncharacterized protein
MLSSVARRTAGEFFAAVDGVLTGGTTERAVEPAVFTRPAAPSRPGELTTGVLVGAAVALLGALVGGLIAARARRR